MEFSLVGELETCSLYRADRTALESSCRRLSHVSDEFINWGIWRHSFSGPPPSTGNLPTSPRGTLAPSSAFSDKQYNGLVDCLSVPISHVTSPHGPEHIAIPSHQRPRRRRAGQGGARGSRRPGQIMCNLRGHKAKCRSRCGSTTKRVQRK